MELIYLWVDKYKNIKNTGLILNPEYEEENIIENNSKLKSLNTISLKEKINYKNIFGNNLNIMTFVGRNGSGKSNFVQILTSILRSISTTHNTKFKDKNQYDDNSIPNECQYCLIIKLDKKYIAYCSDNCINDIQAQITNKKGETLVAIYQDIPNSKHPFKKKRIEQTENKKINVAKFQPFYRNDDLNPVNFTQDYDINNIAKIKLKNYFYYDRFRLYDTVRNLIELYNFDKKNKLNIFENDNARLRFTKYSPYVDIVEALQWANNRIQQYEENFTIKEVISHSIRQLPYQINKNKDIEYVINDILPRLFFIYALGEVLAIKTNKRYKNDNRKLLISLITDDDISNLDYDTYKTSSKRIEFYRKCINKITNKRLKNMFQAYISYETEQTAKDILRKDYILTGTLLRLKAPVDFKYQKRKKIRQIEDLKGISKNLYMEEVFDFMSLSTGEQRLLRFFADVYYCAAHLKNTFETNVYIFDEMDLSWHPEWQRKMIYYIMDLFNKISSLVENKNRKFNILFTTHSPFILSDMPKDNVIFLRDGKNITKEVYDKFNLNTFGANIHDLFNSGLFFDCQDCNTLGEFARQIIQNDIINGIEHLSENNQNDIEYKINLIGDQLLKQVLLDSLYMNDNYKKATEENIDDLKLIIKEMSKRIKELEKNNKNEKN